MGLTKERKILIAVAGVACGIFMLDRVLMGGAMSGPTQAQAAGPSASAVAFADANTPALTIASAPTTPIELNLATSAQTTTSLAQRLAHAGRHLPAVTPNAFSPSSRWQAPAPAEQPVVQTNDFDARAFADRNPLDAVFASPQGATAMVDGRATRQGDVRDGMTLTDIGDRWVVWSGGGVRVKVHLDPVH